MTLKPLAQEKPEIAEDCPMPVGVGNIYLFDMLNAVSWTVVLGTPMLLYYQHLNASATILALAASMSPILNILQIPAADYVERIGYRRFVLSGWTARSFLVIGMAVLAFLQPVLSTWQSLTIMLALSFIYNAMRGISACGLLPWFTALIPEKQRGQFLAKDQAGVAAACLFCLIFCCLFFSLAKSSESFGWVFTISAAAAFGSLIFLRRIPDIAVAPSQQNKATIPWREIVSYWPFLAYLRYNVIINLALGASAVFWIRFFRVFLHVGEARVLFIACITNAILVVALLGLASLADRVGNKQLLILSGVLLIAHYLGWAAVAAGLLPFSVPVIGLQVTTVGLGTALWNIANIRYVMCIVPEMGRPHFLALYSVAGNLTAGCSPLLWGPVLDHLAGWQHPTAYWTWNCFSLFYLILVGFILIGLVALRAMKETALMPWKQLLRELVVKTPGRALSRLTYRLRSPSV